MDWLDVILCDAVPLCDGEDDSVCDALEEPVRLVLCVGVALSDGEID